MAQVAQTLGKTFTDKIDLSDWPGFCREVIEGQVETIDKDKMILGTLNIISGVLPSSLYSLYNGRRISAPMYNILYGGFATKKGDLEAYRQLVTPLKHEMRRLMRMINRCQRLTAELSQTGYAKSDRIFTPKQVRLIVKHLDEP